MKGYRTAIFNAAVAMAPVFDLLANSGALFGEQAAAVVSVIGLVNLILRWITTTPIFKAQ
jgi:hypothetical protein